MPGQQGLQGRFIGWAAVAVLATYALFVGGAWAPTYSVFFRIMTLILCALGIAVWVVVAIRDPFWRPRSVLAPAFAAAFAAFLISTIASRFPRFGFEYLAWSIILAALYLLLQRLMASSFFRVRLLGFATLSALVIGIWYVASVVPQWFAWWGIIGRFAAPPLRPTFESLVWGNPSAVLTASVLLTAPAVATLWGGALARWLFLGLLVALSLFAIVASGSRAGWLAVAIALGTVAAIWLGSAARRRSLVELLNKRAVRIATVPLAAVAIVGAVLVGPSLIFRTAAGGETIRTGYYLASLRMFESSPMTGTGPGTWAPLRIANTLPTETDYYIPHAHNIYLQVLAEFGVVGLAAGVVTVLLLARLLSGAIRDPDPARQRMGWAALFTTIYFGAHQTLDFYANAPSILFAFAIPIALLDATAPPDPWLRSLAESGRRVQATVRRASGIVGVVAVAIAVVFLGWSESAALQMNDGTILLNDQREEEAVTSLANAVAMDPAMTPYRFAYGLALTKTGDLGRAAVEFAAAAEGDLPEAWLNLASVQASLGDRRGALDALDQSMRLGFQQAAVALGAGHVALGLGDVNRATASFADALTQLPGLAGDPWWAEDPARKAAFEDAYAIAFTRAGPFGRFEMALERGDEAAQSRALEAIADPSTKTTYTLIREAWNGGAEEIATLEQHARSEPFNFNTANWCARILRRAGNPERAETYTKWAETVAALSSVGGFEPRVVNSDESYTIAGVNSLFYGHFTYRRPTPSDQLVPALPHLAYR